MEALCEAFAPVAKIEADSPDVVPDFIRTEIRPLNELVLSETRFSPGQALRTPCASSKDDDVLMLSIATKGVFIRRDHRDREHLLRPGEACIGLLSERRFPTHASFLDIAIPSALLESRLAKPDLLTAPPVRNGTALRLLTHYARGLISESGSMSQQLAGACEDHLLKLASLALSGSNNGLAAHEPGVRAARLHALQSDIRANLSRPELSPDWIASRQGISVQYLRALFNGAGTTFRDYVLNRRLEQAYVLLNTNGTVQTPISAIAFGCGFGDLSYFNRTFRRRYGMTPSDVRARCREQDLHGQ